MRPHRPFLVGLVCWVLILAGSYGGYKAMRQIAGAGFAAALQLYPYPPSVAATILFGMPVVMIVCGICLYEGMGWARFPYLVLMVPGFVQRFLEIPSATNPALARYEWYGEIALYLLSAVILFLPRTNRFFKPPLYIDE